MDDNYLTLRKALLVDFLNYCLIYHHQRACIVPEKTAESSRSLLHNMITPNFKQISWIILFIVTCYFLTASYMLFIYIISLSLSLSLSLYIYIYIYIYIHINTLINITEDYTHIINYSHNWKAIIKTFLK